MSDTPLTDHEESYHSKYDKEFNPPEATWVSSDLSRRLERDRAKLIAALKEAATLLAWCGGNKNMAATRKFNRLIAKMEGEK